MNSDAFTAQNLSKAGYAANPLTDGSLKQYAVFEIPISTLNERSLDGLDMTSKQKDLTKNFFALGIMFWLYGRDSSRRSPGSTTSSASGRWSRRRTSGPSRPATPSARRPRCSTPTTTSRRRSCRPALTGTSPATRRPRSGCWPPRSSRSGRSSTARYPITPASDILHQLSGYKNFGVKTFQAEDEIAAIGAAIGASYGGALGLTASSGPGIALKSEAIGLAVMVELPLVVIDVQRAGPSTGMPTKNEQADLLQVMFGRNSDSPLPVVAPATPGECFDLAIEAWRLALKYVTPVVYLSDAFLATGAEPWRIPDVDDLPDISRDQLDGEGDVPPVRARPEDARPEVGRPGHARPGAPHRRPREGRHHRQRQLRPGQPPPDAAPAPGEGRPDRRRHPAARGLRAGAGRPADPRLGLDVRGDPQRGRAPPRPRAGSVAHAHLRHLNPFPSNTEKVLRSYRRVLIPEVNLGQLLMLIRAQFLIDAEGYNQVRGKPFRSPRS